HALRRQYQLQRLMKTMGQGGTAEAEHLDTLALEWLGVGPTEEATYMPLIDRFKECRKRALATPRRGRN
ncbi:MAG TPA: hypothetical protein VMZ53_01915, partial [Kofleriaceae bacterium]|nr:hypothetical protein [Kofleriaceae bacterium]